MHNGRKDAIDFEECAPLGTLAIFGDSISTFQGAIPSENRAYYSSEDPVSSGVDSSERTWWSSLAADLGLVVSANASYSGSMVEGIGFPAGCSKERAAQVLGPDGSPPDAILVFMGINDYGWGSAQAQARGRSLGAPSCALEGDLPAEDPGSTTDADLQGFSDAYKEMLANLKEHAPNSEIYCMTLVPGRLRGREVSSFCHSLRGIGIGQYNRAIVDAANSMGCTVVDIASLGREYRSIDGTHPDAIGMQEIALMVEGALSKLHAMQGDGILEERVEAYESSCEGSQAIEERVGDLLPATRRCQMESCIGCSFARSTGRDWSLVCDAPEGEASPRPEALED